MNELSRIFEYEGNKVTFRNERGMAYVNATEMSKPFGKHPWKWIELPSTREFLNALSENRSLARNELVMSVRGGINPESRGNWFHEDVALEYARWLSVGFRLWCNDRIKELLTVGMTALPQTLEDMVSNPDLVIHLATKLKEQRAEIERMRPKEVFSDAVSGSDTSILVGELAKILKQNGVNIGQNRLYTWMRDNDYVVKRGGIDYNLPTQKSMNLGLFEIVEKIVPTYTGDKVVRTTRVTGKGQQYFVKKFLVN